MDRVVGNYTGQENRSFPLDCETLEAIQNNIDMLGALGNMIGDKTILSGCKPKTNGGRTAGYVFLKTTAYPMGEVLHFAESYADSEYLHLMTTSVNVNQGEVTYNGAYTTRKVEQGTGVEQWEWAEMKEPVDIVAIADNLRNQMDNIQNELPKITPLGVVEMYSGSSIPNNYAKCDGRELDQTEFSDLFKVIGKTFNKSNTATGKFCLPDLSGRFVVGQSDEEDYNTIGNIGGEKTHKLTPKETALVSHNHTATCTIEGKHSHSISSEDGNDGGSGPHELGGNNQGITTGEAGEHTHTIDIAESGEKEAPVAHENRPPYFVLCYIMRLK